jgi:hypothetical protein
MKVFLDTNIFYNDWFVKSANFKYLFHFLNNEGGSLIISKIVLQEVENIRRRHIDLCISEIDKQFSKLKKLHGKSMIYDKHKFDDDEYKLLPLLESKLDYIEVINCDGISHDEVVERALTNKKPFRDGEKGYRDTLIWISFLNHISQRKFNDNDIVFITNNKSDFFNVRNKNVKFHEDLESDLKERKVKSKINIYTSLFDFVKSTVDTNEHAIDRANSDEIFEDFITECGADFIENMSNIELAQYYESSIFKTKVRDILDIRVDVWEGLEDHECIDTTKLDDNDIYIIYKYNLRRVTVEIDIPESDYLENKDELNDLFTDVGVSSGVATLTSYVRPYFDVSFIYNDKDGDLKNYEVAYLFLRRK